MNSNTNQLKTTTKGEVTLCVCGGLIETEYEWLGEVNGIGQTDAHERCEDCGKWRVTRSVGG